MRNTEPFYERVSGWLLVASWVFSAVWVLMLLASVTESGS